MLDCSESMAGDNAIKLENGLNALATTLKKDPNALENVYISVIAFAGIAKTIVSLIEIASFYLPKLPLGSGTSLGAALNELMFQIDTSIIKTTKEQKGDWKPIVFLITDGKPTDSYKSEMEKWKIFYSTKARLIVIAVGQYADIKVFRGLSDDILYLENSHEDDFSKFISWVTASISVQSKNISIDGTTNILDKIDKSFLQKIDDNSNNIVDIDCAVLIGKCQHTKKSYLMKYDCNHLNLTYSLAGCFPINDEYYKWSDSRPMDIKINTNELYGVPGCPYCGAISAFALCQCGKLMCTNGVGENICPWCETIVFFEPSDSDSKVNNGFDVARGRG